MLLYNDIQFETIYIASFQNERFVSMNLSDEARGSHIWGNREKKSDDYK